MIKTFSLLLFALLFGQLSGQAWSVEVAKNYAHELHNVEILTKKGRDMLIDKIESGELRRRKSSGLTEAGYSTTNELFPSQLLGFLSVAFETDYYYRSGFAEQMKFVATIQEDYRDQPITEEQVDSLQQIFMASMETFEGYLIEKAIETEDTLQLQIGWTAYPPFQHGEAEEFNLIHASRSVFGRTYRRNLKDLLRIGLIDQKTLEETLQAAKNGRLSKDSDIMQFAAASAAYYEDFQENKKGETVFLQQLQDEGLISSKGIDQIHNDEPADQLLSKFTILTYCEGAEYFDLADYSKESDEGYQQIFEKLRTLIPNFNYTDFTFELIEDENSWGADAVEQRGRISFSVNDIQYSHEFYYGFRYTSRTPNQLDQDSFLRIRMDFHKGVNKYLSDLGVDYRLYYANNTPPPNHLMSKDFALILLTEEQSHLWMHGGGDIMYEENHDNNFNTKNVEVLIDTYESLGLFDHLTEEEKTAGRARVQQAEIKTYVDILARFPKIIVYFDWESANLENPYEELTEEFGAISRGAFSPANIVDQFAESWEKETTLYSFDFAGQHYSTQLQMQSDWLDPEFMAIIESALKENGVDGSIYTCIDDGQAAGYIFLNQKQVGFLEKEQPALFIRW